MPVDKKAICIVCNKRQQRRVNRTCVKCNALVNAEGSHELYGISRLSAKRQQWAEDVKRYNELARKKLCLKEIADIFGLTSQQLRNRANRWKTRGGLKVVPLWSTRRVQTKAEPATSKTTWKPNEHGGGKWGKKGCECDPCIERRRLSKREVNRTYREQMKQNKPS